MTLGPRRVASLWKQFENAVTQRKPRVALFAPSGSAAETDEKLNSNILAVAHDVDDRAGIVVVNRYRRARHSDDIDYRPAAVLAR